MRKIVFGLFVMTISALSYASTLTGLIAHNQANGRASIDCRLSGPFHYRTFTLNNPDRVVIDFTNTTTRLSSSALNIQESGIIQHIRQGTPTPNVLRIVLDTRTAAISQVSKSASGLRISLAPKSGVQQAQYKPAPVVQPKQPQFQPQSSHPKPVAPPAPVTRVNIGGYRNIMVVLDPGHGGQDPGAIGPEHTMEKNITLSIAKTLKQFIDRQPGMRAILTRDGDRYVGLRQRLKIARKYNADVFISIHADAFNNKQSHGASVFALSERGATSEAARWLAEKENYSELGGVNLKHLDDKNGMIRTVLLDLSQTATISASLKLGSQILQDLHQITALHNQRVEQARFVVLKSPDTPSILIETGFISNPAEAKKLANTHYQQQLTRAIFAGLKRYFWSNPPHGTHLEALVNASHKIATQQRIQRFNRHIYGMA